MVKELLTDKGLRATPHRLRIGQKVLTKHGHFSADELCDWSTKQKNAMSRATVYNILNEFVAVGLLKSFYSSAIGKTIYDSNTDNHFHLYDVDSDEIIDLDPKILNIDVKNLKDKKLKNYKVERMEILLTGRKR